MKGNISHTNSNNVNNSNNCSNNNNNNNNNNNLGRHGSSRTRRHSSMLFLYCLSLDIN